MLLWNKSKVLKMRVKAVGKESASHYLILDCGGL